MGKLKDKIQNIKMPHTYVILTMILLTVVALTYIIPAGEYDRILDPVSNKMIVIPESFHFTQGVRPGFFDIFLALQRGYVSAANILFLIIFAYGYVYVLIDNGTLSSLINCLIKAMGSRTYLIIPVSMLAFGILGSTMGIYEEVYGMVPVFVGIAAALGYDVVVGAQSYLWELRPDLQPPRRIPFPSESHRALPECRCSQALATASLFLQFFRRCPSSMLCGMREG